MTNTTVQATSESDFDFQAIIALFLGNIKWYILSVAICVSIAIFYIYRTQPRYTRELKVLIDDSSQRSTLQNLGVLADVPSGFMGNATIANEIETFSSPDLMEMVVLRLGLQTQYTEKQFLRSRVLFQNSPIEMKLAGDNPASGFSFKVSAASNGKVRLYAFRFLGERLSDEYEVSLGDTVSTPVGKLVLVPTSLYEGKLKNTITVSWNTSMERAKQFGHNLNIAKVTKEAKSAKSARGLS